VVEAVEVPLFPLAAVALFPGFQAPLHVFEPRYRQMMEAALAGSRRIGMVAVVPDHHGAMAGDPPVFEIGCAGFIGRHERLSDGRYHLVLRDGERFRIVRERLPEGGRLFRTAEVEWIGDGGEVDGLALQGMRRRVVALLGPLLERAGDGTPAALDRLGTLDDVTFVNALCLTLGLPCEDKQALLEAEGVLQRLGRLEGMLEFQLARLRAPAGAGTDRLH
jgi:Lon protease-like protein